MRPAPRSVMVALLPLALAATPVLAEPTHVVSVQGGGGVGLNEYAKGLKLSGGYAYQLDGRTWLDLAAGVLVLKHTDLSLHGGVRWRFARSDSGVHSYLRLGLETAFLVRQARAQVAIAPRVAGGLGYSTSDVVAATLELGLAMGPAFGDGVDLAAELDILVGAQFPF